MPVPADNPAMCDLQSRIRRWTLLFMAGLVVSGATALPIATEVGVAARALGEDFTAGERIPEFAASWFRRIHAEVGFAAERAPILFYGTDWLAFGHFMIALAFVGALRDPVRNRWLYTYGMIACALVPIWALLFGEIRGIPLWWRAIDSCFGILGFIPVWLCSRWIAELEARTPPR
jgi:hypothetical protein